MKIWIRHFGCGQFDVINKSNHITVVKFIYFHRKIQNMTNAIFHLNWPMVLLCTVIYYAIGAIWYSVLFGKTWARLNGFDTGDRSGFVKVMIIGFILTFGICATSGLLINAMGGCKQWDCFLIRSY